MKWNRLLRLFGKHQAQRTARHNSRRNAGRRPSLELLESRELLSGTAPTIIAVTPPNGSTQTLGHPQMTITFSEDMNAAEAQTKSNYLLFNANGTQVSIDGATYNPANHQVSLDYNLSNNLSAGTYTLFVQGDKIHDSVNNLPLAHANQLIVANSGGGGANGGGTISVVNVPENNTLGALTNYFDSAVAPKPAAVAFADVNGDGIADLIVANSGTNTVDVFLGLAGNRFAQSPSQILNLPAGAVPKALVVADFNGDGMPDIAVANSGTNNVTVFLDNKQGKFGAGTNYNAGKAPIGIVAADLEHNGTLDLAVADSQPDLFGKYDVTVLSNSTTSKGSFSNTPASFDTALIQPTGLAAGDIEGSGFPDLVVSSGTGARVMHNGTAASGTLLFTGQPLLTNLSTTAVAVGRVNNFDFNPDVVVTTSANGGQALVFQNQGAGAFRNPVTLNTGASPTSITIGDLNGDGQNDLLFTNGTTPSTLTVFINTSIATLSFANPVTYTVNGIAVAGAVHLTSKNNKTVADEVATANSTGNDTSVLQVNSDGTLSVSTDIGLNGTTPTSLVVGDLNGDNVPDIVIGSVSPFTGNDTITVFLSQSGGGYAAPVNYSLGTDFSFFGAQPMALALADLSNTGKLDIIAVRPADNTFTVLSNSGTGTFTILQKVKAGPQGNVPTGIAVGDFNRDGNLDLAISETGVNGVYLFFGNGDRTFQIPFFPGQFTVVAKDNVDPVAVATADFNKDGKADLAVLDGSAAGNVEVLLGDGFGGFIKQGLYAAGDNPQGMAVGDLNNDGYPDIVVTNQTTPFQTSTGFVVTGYVSTLLNGLGTGFGQARRTDVLKNVGINNNNPFSFNIPAVLPSISITTVDGDAFPDLIVTTSATPNNVATLRGAGDGTFLSPAFYATDGGGAAIEPSLGAVSDNPLIPATTFTIISSTVGTNLLENGTFEQPDLAGEKGNLVGWKTFDETNSHGQWSAQTGATSEFSGVPVAAPPQGQYAAMLDEADRVPPVIDEFGIAYAFGGPAAQPSDYTGTHVLYQDFQIPVGTSQATLTLSLYINNADPLNTVGYTDPIVTRSLDYTQTGPNGNQQVRVDVMDPTAPILDVGTGVLLNVFHTDPTTKLLFGYQTFTVNLAPFVGKSLRLRIAEVNTDSKLIVGVDNASVLATFPDSVAPSIVNVHLRNPGFDVTSTFGGNSSDPTITGTVNANGSPSNIAYLLVDPDNSNFKGPNVFKVTPSAGNVDAVGNFTFTLPNVLPSGFPLLPGPITVQIEAVDGAGNVTPTSFTFNLLGPSTTAFRAMGPGPIRYVGEGVNYNTVSGNVTAVVVDPRDATGNTYYVGSDNGGVWKTIDGGNDWTPLSQYITDATLGGVPTAISSLALDPRDPGTVYATTGLATNQATAQRGLGILKFSSTTKTWTVLGRDVFNGARISKMQISAPLNDVEYLIVAVASGGQFGPGVYRSTDGGATWVDTMVPSNMGLDAGGTVAAGTPIASATDVEVDPIHPENVWAGLGNVGMAPVTSTAGLWFSNDHGGTWQQIIGGHDPKNLVATVLHQTIPSGATVGRLTIAIASGHTTNEQIVYIMMGTPPPGAANPLSDGTSFNPGATGLSDANIRIGLYKTRNGGLSWTPIMLRENNPDEPSEMRSFENLFTLGHEASDVGALVVDPNNAAVLYVGGSTRYNRGTDPEENFHGFLRVDTSNMRDTEYESPFYNTPTFPNDGDDIVKAADAAEQVSPFAEPGSYPKTAPGGTGGYTGEGVFWYDLQTSDFGQGPNGVSVSSVPFNPQLNIPATINALAVDALGRLLVGTAGGIYRGVTQGFTYDVTSGGSGIAVGLGVATPQELGMKFTDVNGNLQIADMTSVAIDPYTRNTLDSAQANTGWAQTTGGLTWNATPSFPVPSAFNGFFDGFASDGPFAGPIVVGPRNPTAVPGTVSTVYRTHQQVVFIPTQIEVSRQGGAQGTWTDATVGIGLSDITTSVFLPLAVNMVQTPDQNGTPQDELLYWTNKIYETDNSAFNWDPSSRLLPAAGDLVTALGLAPSQADQFYVGTRDGHVFVTLNNGSDGYPQKDPGPARRVNGFGFDPNNPSNVYALFDGNGGGHVFQTTNGGGTWKDVSGNLPDVPVYSMAIDPRPLPGFAGERLYVGTPVGVFVSTDNGAHWTQLGLHKNADGTTSQTLPNAPVVSLQLNADFNELVAGTLGYGAYQISTEVTGPRVISFTPNTPVSAGIDSLTLTFNEPVDPRSFTPAQVTAAIGPNGPIHIISVKDLDPVNHLSFLVTFNAQNKDGIYNFTFGPNITDLLGSPMDQNGNGVNGEVPQDEFTLEFTINATDDGRFITAAYHDLLTRAADTQGFLSLLSGVDAARFQLLAPNALTVITSDEARGNEISSTNPALTRLPAFPFYQTFLNRTPSAAEVNGWVQAIKSGWTQEMVITGIAGSDEYFMNDAGDSDTTFVTSLYSKLLGRTADTGGLSSFIGFLTQAEANSRAALAGSLTASTEYFTAVVSNAYQTYLRRSASSGELAAVVPQMGHGLTDEGLIAGLVGSDYYFQNIAGSNNSQWLNQAYQDILGRPVDSGAAPGWMQQLNNGTPRSKVAAALLSSTEYFNDIVRNFYTKYLHRVPSQTEVNSWVGALQRGFTDEGIISGLIASPEYFNLHSGNATTQIALDNNWINAAFTDLLNRGPNGTEANSFMQALQAAERTAHGTVVNSFVNGDEYRFDLINDTYQTYLGRPAGAAEINIWLPVLQQGSAGPGKATPDEQFFAGIVGSGEFFFDQTDPANGLHTNAQWFTALYRDFLGRAPLPAELSIAVDTLLSQYQPQRLAVTSAMDTSTEYRTDLIIQLFRTYLRRGPSAGEISSWLGQLAAGATDENLITSLISSVEYFQNPQGKGGANDNSIWLNQVYLDLFGRGTTNDPGAQNLLDQLNQGKLTRTQIANILIKSDEYRFRLINIIYQTYLGRTPGTGEATNWVNAIKNGLTDERIIALIMASPEYFDRQLTPARLPVIYP